MAVRTYKDKFGERSDWVSIPAPKTAQQESKLSALPNDEVLHRVINGVHYERVMNTKEYHARWWGVEPDKIWDKMWDAEFNRMLNSIPEGKTLYLPSGEYMLEKGLFWQRRVNLKGDGGDWGKNPTLIYKPSGNIGIQVLPKAGGSHFEDFLLRGYDNGQSKQDGLNPNGSYNDDQLSHQYHGFLIESVVTLNRVHSTHHTGHGIYFRGAIGDANHTNSSHATMYNCNASDNRGSGFFMKGPDANTVKGYACMGSDNGGYGWGDMSMLGCHTHGFMAHYNRLGDFYVQNHGSNFAIYSEGGSPPSQYKSFFGMEVGGINESGTIGDGYKQSGVFLYSKLKAGFLEIDRNTLRFDTMYFTQVSKNNWAMNMDRGEPAGWVGENGLAHSHNDSQLRQPGTPDHLIDQREMQIPVFNSEYSLLGGRFYGGVDYDLQHALSNAPYNRQSFLVNDYLHVKTYTVGSPMGYICIQKGMGMESKWQAIYPKITPD